MAVTVRLFAALREARGEACLQVELQPGDTPRAVFERLFADRPHPAWPGALLFAVDEEYTDPDGPLADGCELALIPPLGGGAPDPRVGLTTEALVLDPLVDLVSGPERGGVVTFAGTVRDHFGGRAVTHLEYEAYAPMALRQMSALCDEIEQRWPGVKIAMVHRVGVLEIGDAAVLVAAAGGHRPEAFEACRFGIDSLKERVPIFKKEVYADGSTWKDDNLV